ncbi:pilus assembly/adherence protein PilC [Neisseria meningitidis]|nr:pilus assembly/adherence protein PilC [Neisseria meningitidis]MBG8745973.1 pilus assembly/adherence protein PilC [Neisseria meningitidis]MBG8768593.1 pilus assembly/adherence protein PilC [Neisseria meningitidis]MBG8782330.1 pilus assembly/adherence protein PilC [Neisseria meningitidis]MBG9162553.1 pilus assembly/adherence protein PilC [Neisseria meningitidis]
MNKTLKRQVFRHTALYAAILMFSHTGGGGAQAETHNYAIVMNEQNQLKVKQEGSYSTLREKDRERKFIYNRGRQGGGSVFFDNTDTLVSRQSGTAVFGTATYLPPYGKVSGFDERKLKERNNAVDWIHTTRAGLAGYAYTNVICRSSDQCPQLVYETKFSFDGIGLVKNAGRLDRHSDQSRENSPIYKLKDHPWLGVSFNLGSENTVKNGNSFNRLISSFSEDNNNQTIVSTTRGHLISLGDQQREHTAMAYYLNAKLHLLDKKGIKDIAQGKTVDLGTLRPRVEAKVRRGGNLLNFWATWKIEDKGNITVRLDLPEVKAGRCTNAAHPNSKAKPPSPALTAPALWFGPVQNGKAEMYSASVSTYPDSSSSRIFLQNLKRKNDPNKPGRYSLADLSASDIQSKEPTFTSRQTVIRLDKGVHQIKLQGNEVTGFNGNSNNATFGIVSEGSFMPDASEWKKVLLPWTVRASNDDGQFNTFNKKENNGKPTYSQKYRSRDNSKRERDLGDIVNSPIVAVGEYLATSANDGMVHIFKKGNGGDERNYSLKLSYIPGTMPRKDIQSQESTLAKELRAFAEKGYVGDRYGVDGGFVLREVERGGKKHVFMFGAMGFGGRGAYALDLTKVDSNNPTAVSLFDVKNDNNNGNNGVKLGYTVGTPQIGKTHNGKYAAFLASGYATKTIDSTDNKTALYVYDLENNNGTPIATINVPDGKGGLSSPTLVDKDLDGTIDIAYAGDRSGKMYRFDLSSQSPDQWTVRPIFEGTKPITSAPAISQLKDKRVVIFGTGSDLSEEDVDKKDEQYIYGIFDDDTATTGTVNFSGTGGGLLEQHLTEENKTLFLTDYKRSDGSGDKGWVVKLEAGQRVTVKPTVVLRTAFVTIRKYNDGGCGAETAILGINTADGGKLTKKSARPIVPEANTAVAQYSGHKQTANGKSIPIGCMWKNNETVCPNGYVYDKPVNVRYLDEKKTDGFSTTADGDAGGSGIDPDGKRAGKNNRCFSQKGVRTLLMNDLDSLDITGPTCGMKRISWREVFF